MSVPQNAVAGQLKSHLASGKTYITNYLDAGGTLEVIGNRMLSRLFFQ